MKNHIENVILSIANEDMKDNFTKFQGKIAFTRDVLREIISALSGGLFRDVDAELVEVLMLTINHVNIDGEKYFFTEGEQFNSFLEYRLGL